MTFTATTLPISALKLTELDVINAIRLVDTQAAKVGDELDILSNLDAAFFLVVATSIRTRGTTLEKIANSVKVEKGKNASFGQGLASDKANRVGYQVGVGILLELPGELPASVDLRAAVQWVQKATLAEVKKIIKRKGMTKAEAFTLIKDAYDAAEAATKAKRETAAWLLQAASGPINKATTMDDWDAEAIALAEAIVAGLTAKLAKVAAEAA